MSLRDITTKFDYVTTITEGDKKIKISKAVDDEVYQIVTYVKTAKFTESYSLYGAKFISERRYKTKFNL